MRDINGAYVRRQEMVCTEADLTTYGDKVLLDGEVIYVRMNDGSVAQKMGNGTTPVSDLPFTDFGVEKVNVAAQEALTEIANAKAEMLEEIELAAEIVQTTGDSETAVMSQDATTKSLANLPSDCRNLAHMTTDGYIGAVGQPVDADASTKEKYSTLIPVSEGEVYLLQEWATVPTTSNGWMAVAFYSKGLEFISRPAVTFAASAGYGSMTITVPALAAYMRVTGRAFDDGKFMLTKGTIPYTYMAFDEKVHNNVSLLDMDNTFKGFVTEDGRIDYNSDNGERCSDYIKVVAGSRYTLRSVHSHANTEHWHAMCFYDANKTFISRLVNRGAGADIGGCFMRSNVFTAPENAVYARASARTYGDGFMDLHMGTGEFPYNDGLGRKYGNNLTFVPVLPPVTDYPQYRYPFFAIDTSADTLTIPFDTLIFSEYIPGHWKSLRGDGAYGTPSTISLSAVTSSAVCVYYDIANDDFYVTNYAEAVDTNNYLLLCCYRRGRTAYASCPVLVDGKLHSIDNSDAGEDNSDAGEDNSDAGDIKFTNKNIKSINHRGYNSVAPENTLSAYKLSKKKGFEYVECDVAFTSDNVAVLLHDSTVDRTSNGTGHISELTFDEVRAMDFGSWKSTAYAGEQIPTFEEFMVLCRNLGLHPYIEIKSAALYTESQIQSLVDIVKKVGMKGKVSYISFHENYLTYVKNYDSAARLGFICGGVTSSQIAVVNGLKTDTNEVFLDGTTYDLTNESIALCIQNDIPLEVWDLQTATSINAADPYISGFTCDAVIGGNALIDSNIC